MANNTKLRMPKGIRNKLMAALCMLLVSTIMLVSATYAWFTLSTAPEVTGITTSVGANGNLEIALLTTATFDAPETITSAVGDSSETQGKNATTANITWGNIVDLSDASYGLSDINLNQSMANITNGVLNPTNPLKTARYGADGRVIDTDEALVSAIKDENSGEFKYVSGGGQTYGVRAVGQASNITQRQTTFNSAKSAVAQGQTAAKNAAANAIDHEKAIFTATALAGLSGQQPTAYTVAEVNSIISIANGLESSLNTIVRSYANAALVAAAASDSGVSDEQVATLKGVVNGGTGSSASAILTALPSSIDAFNTPLNTLATAQSNVAGVKTALNAMLEANTGSEDFTAATNFHGEANDLTFINSQLTVLAGNDYVIYDGDTLMNNPGMSEMLAATAPAVYMTGGVLNTIASYTGNFMTTDIAGVDVIAGAKGTSANWPNVASYQAPAGAAESNIAADNTYGYVLDFAFRTNAADSFLKLQKTAANRVYADANDNSLATMGGGSTVSFTYPATTSDTQAETLLEHVALVFFDPDAGTVYATGAFENISASNGTATADVTLVKDNPEQGTEDNIVALNQNEIKFVSVLVYLDGETISNEDVANAATSGTLDLNLQFSSSATLVPMENTALRTKTAA